MKGLDPGKSLTCQKAPAMNEFRFLMRNHRVVRSLTLCLHLVIFLPIMAQRNTPSVTSILKIYDLESRSSTVVMEADFRLEAPNWTPDGEYLVYNSEGHLFKIPVAGGEAEMINTGFADQCNNDHLLSPDGSMIALSHRTAEDNRSRIYVVPFEGGDPVLITPMAPSFLHGWSPDGGRLAYCAEREGNYDVYTIPAMGGVEKRLTHADGLDDGPEYSRDGQHIYFNSIRTGTMEIWRMKTDGSELQQLTDDPYHNWFPHPSPDGEKIVFLSYEPDVEGHPPYKQVTLRVMPASGGKERVLLHLFGGQGTINVPSWSPDSKKFAYVEYFLER